MTEEDSQTPELRDRDQLIAALRFASIIEHMLACEYLYAAFSLKKTLHDYPDVARSGRTGRLRAQAELDTIRPWLAQTYTIARQEMEHLGIVQNLLAALGEEPYFMRPAFPVSAKDTFLHAPFRLDPFGDDALRRFIWYERPDYLTEQFEERFGDQGGPPLAEVDSAFLPDFLRAYDSVTKLYSAIRTAFTTLSPSEVFVGPPARQIGEGMFGYRVQMMPVSNRETATAAIDLILEQGEGIGESPQSDEPAHFERFLTILDGYDTARETNCDFEPALPVVSNPWIVAKPLGITLVGAEEHVHRVTNPGAVMAMELFNDAYSLMLVMMKSFFGTYSGIDQPEAHPQAAMFYAAFFPLMTMVVRPLGEIIARMPADGEDREPAPGQCHAGASFEVVPEWVEEGPGGHVLRTVLDRDEYRKALECQAKRAEALIEVVPASLRVDAQYLFENLTSTAKHLDHIWRTGR